ncbi:MAG: hypothetical protein ACOYM8_11080 [Caulobacterales bacterium]
MSATPPKRPPFVAFIIDPAAQTMTRVPLGPKRFAVETRFLHGWENCWTIDGEPQTFATRAHAEAELADHLAEVADAVAAGDMIDGYDREDFRIVAVAHD